MLRYETIKFLEENTEGKLHGIRFGDNFLDMPPKGKAMKANVDTWDYIKLENSVQQRKQSTKCKQHMECQKICTNIYLMRGNIQNT